jgi:hypothetical protein
MSLIIAKVNLLKLWSISNGPAAFLQLPIRSRPLQIAFPCARLSPDIRRNDMVEVKRGTSPNAPFELYIEGHLVAQSEFSSVIQFLSEDDAFLQHCHAKFDTGREVGTTPFVKAKVWRDLPDAAKNILEWIESPNTGKKNVITIEVGKRPSLSVSKYTPTHQDGSPIVVDKGLFSTIKFYIENSKAEDEYPYLMTEHAPTRIAIWNEMPEFTMVKRVGR